MNCAADAWSVTVARLEDPLSSRLAELVLHRCYALRTEGGTDSLAVRVLDKPTEQTLIVSWGDARFGRHGYQIWRTVVAQRRGTCVVTGRQIKAGETVYKPRKAKQRMVNADAMICAGILDNEPIEP
ncbi:DUF3331 domain-containing protein [Caballeronia ptereochthonis]|uniref:Ribosomal protein S14 n=1 Tax=Caballeronia ptereochthonis TaxID=1777144 RepID=A0A158AJJ2_9BURK|nr:DUF3331 domain-containing protein [Caballeronia ptereochthonis]SAK58071.1 hypothetical protein AWB83_01955 [Caballeronia ptereochthonis]